MSIISDIANSNDDEEERFLRDYARKEAERDNEEPWESWDDEEDEEDEE